ncbi:hypothetical protein FCM35_KLT18143 [Carex littledalei]|uniref:Uncharacterized protein n=1 Tax=Carex littledalei TaxID=544730 RepID=A0A833VG87_9POAL|nr:hypothetical protein FCM35_KLT18143 [Carex littledalei]
MTVYIVGRESISVHQLKALQNPAIDETDSDNDDHNYDSADEGFSFGISPENSCETTPDLTADEIFYHGHILSLCLISIHTPLSMDDTDTDASPLQPEAAGEIFDVPKIAPGSPMKSWSTGLIRRRNPIHDFLFGGRSHSDGKEKLGFFEKGSSSVTGKKKKKDKGKAKRKELKDANKTDYAKNGEKGVLVKARRRSFLPYIGFLGAYRVFFFFQSSFRHNCCFLIHLII